MCKVVYKGRDALFSLLRTALRCDGQLSIRGSNGSKIQAHVFYPQMGDCPRMPRIAFPHDIAPFPPKYGQLSGPCCRWGFSWPVLGQTFFLLRRLCAAGLPPFHSSRRAAPRGPAPVRHRPIPCPPRRPPVPVPRAPWPSLRLDIWQLAGGGGTESIHTRVTCWQSFRGVAGGWVSERPCRSHQ